MKLLKEINENAMTYKTQVLKSAFENPRSTPDKEKHHVRILSSSGDVFNLTYSFNNDNVQIQINSKAQNSTNIEYLFREILMSVEDYIENIEQYGTYNLSRINFTFDENFSSAFDLQSIELVNTFNKLIKHDLSKVCQCQVTVYV